MDGIYRNNGLIENTTIVPGKDIETPCPSPLPRPRLHTTPPTLLSPCTDPPIHTHAYLYPPYLAWFRTNWTTTAIPHQSRLSPPYYHSSYKHIPHHRPSYPISTITPTIRILKTPLTGKPVVLLASSNYSCFNKARSYNISQWFRILDDLKSISARKRDGDTLLFNFLGSCLGRLIDSPHQLWVRLIGLMPNKWSWKQRFFNRRIGNFIAICCKIAWFFVAKYIRLLFKAIKLLSGPEESQLRPDPSLNILYILWPLPDLSNGQHVSSTVLGFLSPSHEWFLLIYFQNY